MEIKKSSLAAGVLCYMIWGVLPIYWNILGGVDTMLILCFRIVFAFVFTMGLLIASGRTHVFLQTIKNRETMRYLIPASALITFSWGYYIWAVNSGRILDTSLAYYINPLISFLFGVSIFKEHSSKLQYVAVGMAFTGVLISVIAYGSFPYVSLMLALAFACYGITKKKARADPISSIAIESLIVLPLALIFTLVFLRDEVRSVGGTDLLLLIGGGAVTAIPLALYARSVNEIPYIVIGFIQYISPSMTLIYGLLSGEALSGSQAISFFFTWPALILFSIATVITHKRAVSNRLS